MSRVFGHLLVVSMGIVMLLCTGCEFHGGGYILSINGVDRATFGVNGQADTYENITGQGEYNDHGVGVRFHAEFGNFEGCEGPPLTQVQNTLATNQQEEELLAAAIGTYWPQPRNLGPPGCVLFIVLDAGEPGIGEDALLVELAGGYYDGYFNEGYILGGNIQVRYLDEP